MKSDRLYVVDASERIGRIERSAAAGRDAFLASEEKQDAVLRNLQTLAESLRRISDELKARYPDVPWQQVIAFRNVVVHEYMRIDLETVWSIVTERLPPLKQQIARILAELP